MDTRSLRRLALLAGVVVVFWAVLQGSALALAGGGLLCIALSLAVMRLDSQRKGSRSRR